VGGGSASSLMHGENDSGRDFNAVQRGDAEMQQKLQRAIRACVELDEKNPILSIHDQGAGGNGETRNLKLCLKNCRLLTLTGHGPMVARMATDVGRS